MHPWRDFKLWRLPPLLRRSTLPVLLVRRRLLMSLPSVIARTLSYWYKYNKWRPWLRMNGQLAVRPVRLLFLNWDFLLIDFPPVACFFLFFLFLGALVAGIVVAFCFATHGFDLFDSGVRNRKSRKNKKKKKQRIRTKGKNVGRRWIEIH